MPGVDWRQALERQIGELDGVVVLWTPASKDEAAVKDAARLALPAGKLINAVAGDIAAVPLRAVHDGASLGGRRGPFRMDDARRNGRGPRECGERRRASAGMTKNETPPGNYAGSTTLAVLTIISP